jgi:8-oxo-dGTP diphosphatase
VWEVQEELSYFIPAKRFEYLIGITGEDIESDGGGSVRDAFFVAREIPVEALVITEGALLIFDPDNVTALDQRLTPTARFALKAFGTVAARKER